MYKDFSFLKDDHLPIFGGHRSYTTGAGAFSLRVTLSLIFSNTHIGSRVIMFGD